MLTQHLFVMKNSILFILLLVLFCNCSNDNGLEDVGPDNTLNMSINGNALWSDDLLKFVTPVLYFTDAEGEHEIIVKYNMRVEDNWEIGDEVYDFNTESWKYEISYIYTDEDTVYLNLKYIAKQPIEVDEDITYTFEHRLNVTNVLLAHTGKDKPYVISIYNSMGGQNPPERVQCPASDVEKYIGSLVSHPLKRKINVKENGISVA